MRSRSLTACISPRLVFVLLGDVARACQAIADELYSIAERNKFPWPLVCARFLRAWLLTQNGERDTGIDQMLKAAGEPVVVNRLPVLLSLAVQQQILNGQHQAALNTLDRASAAVASLQAHYCEPDIYRLRGQALLQSGGDAGEAEAAFRQSIALAREQSCRAIELRATTALAQLRRDQDRRDEARSLLTPVYQWFTEGFDKPDLKAARMLLTELN